MIPYWLAAVIGLVLLVLGWLWGRGGRKDLERALDTVAAGVDRHAERLGEVGARLAAVEGARQAYAPPVRLAWPAPAAPETVHVPQPADTAVWPTGATVATPAVDTDANLVAADHPAPVTGGHDDLDRYVAEEIERTAGDAQQAVDAIRDRHRRDDEPDDDGGGGDDRDEPGPPSAPQPAPAYAARFGLSAPVVPPGYHVMPDARLGQQARTLARRIRLRQWTRWPVRWWQQARVYAAERWEAAFPAAASGWGPGELTAEQPAVGRVAVTEPTQVLPVVARAPVPRNPRYRPRHDFAEVPPSLRGLAELLPVTLRCTVIARAVSPATWWPRTGTRLELEQWARRVALRNGRLPLLGSFGPKAVLP